MGTLHHRSRQGTLPSTTSQPQSANPKDPGIHLPALGPFPTRVSRAVKANNADI
jgi:hypothetical protein